MKTRDEVGHVVPLGPSDVDRAAEWEIDARMSERAAAETVVGACAVCAGEKASEMTDGQTMVALCDACRPLAVTLFHVHRSLTTAVAEARRATGRG